VNLALTHMNQGYKLIFSESLDTKGCLAFGTVGLGESADTVMEFVLGEGKVRDLDSHPEARTLFIPQGAIIAVKDSDFPGNAHILNSVYMRVKATCYDEIPCVVEWSYYDHQVGRCGTHDIYWELRPYM